MHGRTSIGDLKARIDIPALGQTADGKYCVFMNFVPNARLSSRATGTYKYWRKPIRGCSEYKIHEWSYFDQLNKEWVEIGYGVIHIHQALQWGIEFAADDFDCDVWIEVRTEYLDPTDPTAKALYYNIHIFGLDQVKDLNRFVQAFASRINRDAKSWLHRNVDRSIECV